MYYFLASQDAVEVEQWRTGQDPTVSSGDMKMMAIAAALLFWKHKLIQGKGGVGKQLSVPDLGKAERRSMCAEKKDDFDGNM